MKQTRILMGMPITLEITDASATEAVFDKIFSYFEYIDGTFSTYKETSEITRINNGYLREDEYSEDMRIVLALCEKTKKETDGYFDIISRGARDPSGLVKGWSIYNAARLLKDSGFKNFYIEAGGDIQVNGAKNHGQRWRVGIQDPFTEGQVVKIMHLKDEGVATSGTYRRGQHIYNPKEKDKPITEIVSLTVVGPDVYEADRFATAAFAMGKKGIYFIEHVPGLEGYMIDTDGAATMTSGFEKYVFGYA